MNLLEKDLGVAVFHRGAGGIKLTVAGEMLLTRADSLMQQFRLIREEATAPTGQPVGSLAIGMPPSFNAMVSVPLIARFQTQYPGVTLQIWVETSMQLREFIIAGRVDLAIFVALGPETILEAHRVLQEDIFLVGSPDAKLERIGHLDMEEVAKRPLVLTSRPNSIRMLVEAAAAKRRKTLDVKMEINSIPLTLDLLQSIGAYTLLPYSAVWRHAQEGRVSCVKVRNLYLTWLIGNSHERPLSNISNIAKTLLLETITQRVQSKEWPHARLVKTGVDATGAGGLRSAKR